MTRDEMLRTKDFNSMIEIYVGMEIFRNQTEINDDGVTIPKSWTDAELQSHQDYQSTKDALIADRATMVTTMANEETQAKATKLKLVALAKAMKHLGLNTSRSQLQ
jgi:hypothetical protein